MNKNTFVCFRTEICIIVKIVKHIYEYSLLNYYNVITDDCYLRKQKNIKIHINRNSNNCSFTAYIS